MSIYQRKLFSPALFLMLFAAAVRFDSDSVTWFWREQPQVAAILAAMSIVFWCILLVERHNPRKLIS